MNVAYLSTFLVVFFVSFRNTAVTMEACMDIFQPTLLSQGTRRDNTEHLH